MTDQKPIIPPLSIESAKAKTAKSIITTPNVSAVKTEIKVGREDETPIQYVQRILEEHDGLESNIPVGHDYWPTKRLI